MARDHECAYARAHNTQHTNLQNNRHQKKRDEDLSCNRAQYAEGGFVTRHWRDEPGAELPMHQHRVERPQNTSEKLHGRVRPSLFPGHSADEQHAESDCGVEVASGKVAESEYDRHEGEADGERGLAWICHHSTAYDADKKKSSCESVMQKHI